MDAPRPGRSPSIVAATVQAVIRKTTLDRQANATHWSTRLMASEVGISEASVRRIWRAHGLKPHLVESFKISNDPAFAEKLEAIVDSYLNPPGHGLVLCCDEKSQIQALDRTQPGLPLKRGPGQNDAPRPHQEWLKFLRLLDQTNACWRTATSHRGQLRYAQASAGPAVACGLASSVVSTRTGHAGSLCRCRLAMKLW